MHSRCHGGICFNFECIVNYTWSQNIFLSTENTIRVTYHGNLWIAASFRSWIKRSIENCKPWFLRKWSLCGTTWIRTMEFGLHSSGFVTVSYTSQVSCVMADKCLRLCGQTSSPMRQEKMPAYITEHGKNSMHSHFSKWHFLDVGESWTLYKLYA